MDILDNSETGTGAESGFTSSMKVYLKETAKWGKFLSIVGFVGIGFFVIAAFGMGTIFSKLSNQPGMEAFGGMNMGFGLTFIYLLMGLVWFFPVLYLFKFSTGVLKNIESFNSYAIEIALGNLKSLFKFYGIVTLVFISFYALVIVFALIGGLATLL